ncbi:MAG: Hsp70 family protein [Microbacteriaceae bacterium]|nr:Hsp70 family protein [Microbacteriaceae bacterium]
MRFGIDFGTTRTLVATVDRGNYPVVGVEDIDGDQHEHIPTVVALDGDRLVCGWEAHKHAQGRPLLARSFKRLLALPDVTAETPVAIGDTARPLGEVLGAFARHVVERIRRSPVLAGLPDEPIEAIVGVPANSHSAQRLLTLDAFSRAGAEVLALVNEPSAAAFEYTHRHPRGINSKRTSLVVYDLGGGTFDASLVRIDGTDHEIERSLGVSRLGGDDFDEALADLALAAAGREGDVFGDRARGRLLDEARTAKERLAPQSRRMVLELGDDDVVVPVDAFYEAATPLVERSIDAMRPLIGDTAPGTLADTDIAGIYLVGGASGLPLVPRVLREEFGRRVHRSPYPAASTAIGLAIAADPDSGYRLRDRLARGIGVFRERDSGREVAFDPLVEPDAAAGDDGAIVVERRYRAAHNIGWFRYVEYAAVDAAGESVGDLTPVASVAVPFDPALRDGRELGAVEVERWDDGPEVIETVRVDANGITSIRIELPEQGHVVERSVSFA